MKQIQYINMAGGVIFSLGLLGNIDSVIIYEGDLIQSSFEIQIALRENSDAAKNQYALSKEFLDAAHKEINSLSLNTILTGLGSVLIFLRE